MNDAFLVRRVQGVRDLLRSGQRLVEWNRPLGIPASRVIESRQG
jgi:hypothetical protein